jgi:hypothetical protein
MSYSFIHIVVNGRISQDFFYKEIITKSTLFLTMIINNRENSG